ncbi:hypothetical protein MRB53_039527 [Persea americana]|nr:hypothetical protein MRB53_039527 [Persea americana]
MYKKPDRWVGAGAKKKPRARGGMEDKRRRAGAMACGSGGRSNPACHDVTAKICFEPITSRIFGVMKSVGSVFVLAMRPAQLPDVLSRYPPVRVSEEYFSVAFDPFVIV